MGITTEHHVHLGEKPSFAHLHIHSEYSLMDGAIRIKDLLRKVKDLGHKSVAITDHANMYGAIDFYSQARDAGIKPILGAEIYVEGTPATSRLLEEQEYEYENIFHLVLLAKSETGYKSLMRIVSSAYLQDKMTASLPVVSLSYLEAHAEDLIALSSCLKGELGFLAQSINSESDSLSLSLEKNPTLKEAADAHFNLMQKIFGAENYYAELINNKIARQQQILPTIYALASLYNTQVVATSDAHYLNEDDKEAHTVLTAIKNDLTQSALRDRLKSTRFHVLNNDEFLETYAQWPEAISNTLKIAEQCNVELAFGHYYLPAFELDANETEKDALKRLSHKGLDDRVAQIESLQKRKLTEESLKVYQERLNYELEVINSMGFPGYFLIVQDFINWAKSQGIPVGPGRGSGAGSLVAYALKITDLDPIFLNLIFERFLNPERVSMPDFDVDFCQERRDEVIKYVTEKYGNASVAQITTFGKMKAKAAIRDVGRVLEIGYSRVDKIAKLIPNELDITLTSALEKEPRIKEEASQDDRIQQLIELALKTEGLNRHTSVHAAGIVISQGGMENYVPVYTTEDGNLITQYEMKNAEKVGLVKFDFLGLKTLTVIDRAVSLIKQRHKIEFSIEEIDLEKPEVYDLVSQANTVGVFQLESSGMQALLTKLKPSRFEDIIAVVALFRPGPLGSGMVDDFIERKHGRQKIVYLHPRLESILDDTYGIILYQEQVQKIAAELANYSLGEADLLRRAMGKKKPEEMAKQKARFLEGCASNSIDAAIAEELFELMAKFAAYGFNKSHSAAYGLICYQTAYLKTYFPEEFMAAIMTCDMDNTEKICRYIDECNRMGISVLPPNINRSTLHFDVPADKSVGFALSAIKGIGTSALQPIINERDNTGPFLSLTNLADRVNLQKAGKKTLELLIQTGAFDSLYPRRPVLQKYIPEMIKYSDNHHTAASSGQRLLFSFDNNDDKADANEMADWEESMCDEQVNANPIEWLLKEKKHLGVFLSNHPLNFYQRDQEKFGDIQIATISKHVGEKKRIVAFLDGISVRYTKSGKKMAYIHLQDQTGNREGVMFESDLPSEFPKDSSLVVATGQISESYDKTTINFRISELIRIEDLRRKDIAKAYVKIKTPFEQHKANDNQLLTQIKELLSENPGTTQITMQLCYPKASVTLKTEGLSVDLSDEVCHSFRKLQQSGAQICY